MKNLKTVFGTIVILFGLTSVSNAASLNGVYLEVGTSAMGVEMNGTHNDDDGDISTGSVGKTAIIGNLGIGYMPNRSNKFGFDLGYLMSPGSAKINATSDDNNTDVTFEIDNNREYYIAPMVNITEEASLYLKFGKASADVTTTGDVKNPGDLSGTTIALGTVVSWGTNAFIRTEAGITDYDKISATGAGSTPGIGTDVSVSSSPETAYGKIAIGYKF